MDRPDFIHWLIIGTIGTTLLVLTIREEILRRSGK
jgi:hypothetical protein